MLPQSLEHSPLPAWVSCPSELLNAGILSPFSPPPPPRIVTNKQMSGQGSPSFYKPAATKKNCFGKPKKSVRWGAARTYKSSTSPEEVHVSWYTHEELEGFQKEKRKVIRALKHVRGNLNALEGTKYVTRGFECYQSIDFNRLIRSQRQLVVKNVLRLQQHQRMFAINDPDQIAQAARQQSAWARDFARELGHRDAQNVDMGWKEFFSNHAKADDQEPSDSDSDSADFVMTVVDVFDDIIDVDQADGLTHVAHAKTDEL